MEVQIQNVCCCRYNLYQSNLINKNLMCRSIEIRNKSEMLSQTIHFKVREGVNLAAMADFQVLIL